jgi:hypothetical protein
MNQIPLSKAAGADNHKADEARNDRTRGLSADLAYCQIAIVNVLFFGLPGAGDGAWVLIDAGMSGAASDVRSAVKARFGDCERRVPSSGRTGILITSAPSKTLAAEWDVPVYAHRSEHPYLDGTTSYPPPDPTVGGGLMSWLSPLYPTKPVDVSARLHTLPEDGSVPGWR